MCGHGCESQLTSGPPVGRLLAWYDSSKRDLPWRGCGDAYRIWLSEIMLQQTRVETAVPYYERFVERFPTLVAVAAAREDEVVSAWSGLGYYRRARQFHRAAGQLVADGRDLPRTVDELLELPGIGPYTAAAIASMAFGVVAAVMDGNVERVTSRLLASRGDPKTSGVRERLLAAACDLLDPERPGDSNQALMELGATVCKPREPMCGVCPLAPACAARAAGGPESYPEKKARRRLERCRRLGVVVLERERVLLFRRPPESRQLAGTWEVPSVAWCTLPRAESALAERYGACWRIGPSFGWVRHSITNRALRVEVRQGHLLDARSVSEEREAGWFTRSQLAEVPHSSLVAKVLARAADA